MIWVTEHQSFVIWKSKNPNRQLADGSERSRPGFLIRGRMTARLWVSGRVPYISDIWLIDWLIDWLRPCQSTPTNGHRFTALSPPRRSPIQPRARRYSTSVTDSPSKHWSTPQTYQWYVDEHNARVEGGSTPTSSTSSPRGGEGKGGEDPALLFDNSMHWTSKARIGVKAWRR